MEEIRFRRCVHYISERFPASEFEETWGQGFSFLLIFSFFPVFFSFLVVLYLEGDSGPGDLRGATGGTREKEGRYLSQDSKKQRGPVSFLPGGPLL